ncbi:MAG: glycosyltransferase family 4 protein [Candidatus Tectomicrobia bacterium]|nr:glycosyltransferase family 4 protein [Candidatus Tectomicrobia bacterium]
MDILYISQNFPPEIGAASARAFELSRHWVGMGHRVTILTGFPRYPTGHSNHYRQPGSGALTRRETVEDVSVIRTWLWGIGDRGVRDRVLSYTSFWLSSTLRGIPIPRPDVVIASSPPLTVGLTGWWLSRIKRTPFIFDIRDLWPESITDLVPMTNGSTMVRILGGMSRFLYDRADQLVVTSHSAKHKLIEDRKVEPERIRVIPNGVETEQFGPIDNAEAIREGLGLGGKILVSFIGTIGLAQDVDLVIRSAARLVPSLKPIHFLFIGEGPRKSQAMDAVARLGLSNVTFLPGQKRDEVPGLIQASDICLVTLRKAPVNDSVIPVRMLEFMSCGRPVLLSAGGEAGRIVNAAGAGMVTEQGSDMALTDAIVRLGRDAGLRRHMGEKGRQYVLANFSRAQTAIRYLEVLEEASSRHMKAKGNN